MRWVFLVLFLGWNLLAQAQTEVRGLVVEETRQGEFLPITGAAVHWIGSQMAAYSDTTGWFRLALPEGKSLPQKLEVRFPGYASDTLDIISTEGIRVVLKEEKSKQLKEVEVEGRIPASFLMMDARNTTVMTRHELTKAACCNLSESFETNPSVEVSFTDAVSGARQIQLLGLSGLYTPVLRENMPGTRGLLSSYGLGFTPGPWMESIQVTKGVGSVVNGFESMAGLINVELKKPDWSPRTRERLHVNGFVNSMGRWEANLNTTQKVSPKWWVTHLLHTNHLDVRHDRNQDGFVDLPVGNQWNGLQRWRFDDGKGLSAQIAIQYFRDERKGGQLEHGGIHNHQPWTTHLFHRQSEIFGKIGYVFPNKKYKSIGFQVSQSASQTVQSFGQSVYGGRQSSLFQQLIYQSIHGNTNFRFRAGLSFRADAYRESFVTGLNGLDFRNLLFRRTEIVPGAFYELNWSPSPRWLISPGLRADYHNRFRAWLTPRLHVKFDVTEDWVMRFSSGLGRRVANVLAENTSLMASSRTWMLPLAEGTGYYGISATDQGQAEFAGNLQPEKAWNTGLSTQRSWKIGRRKGNVQADVYWTEFLNQTVVDVDRDPYEVWIYNLRGASRSWAGQVQVEQELARNLDLRLAWKQMDVRQTYHGRWLERPYVSANRFFANLAWKSRSKWALDFTASWMGPKRVPFTGDKAFPERSPSFWLLHSQVSKTFGFGLEVYLGTENMLDFRQENLIRNPSEPFARGFDASLVWGPVIGRMYYGGLRYTLK